MAIPFIYKGISIKQINKNIFEYNEIIFLKDLF